MKRKSKASDRIFLAAIATLILVAMLIANRPWSVSQVSWQPSFNEALTRAKATHRLVFVEFYADWCGPCKEMDRNTFRDTAVERALSNVVAVKVNIDHNPDIVAKYPSSGIPYSCVIDSNGNLLKSYMGYLSPAQFLLFWQDGGNNGEQHHDLFL